MAVKRGAALALLASMAYQIRDMGWLQRDPPESDTEPEGDEGDEDDFELIEEEAHEVEEEDEDEDEEAASEVEEP